MKTKDGLTVQRVFSKTYGAERCFTVTGSDVKANVFHMDGVFNISGRGTKKSPADIVNAVKEFLAAEDASLDEFLNTPESPAPVAPFSDEVGAALSALRKGDYHGAAVIREALSKKWRPGVVLKAVDFSGVHEALDRLDLLAADVLNVNIVIRQDWAEWLEIGPRDDRRQTLTPAAPVQASPVFAELAVIIEAQTAYYRHYVAMSDAMADRGDEYGHAESLRHAVYAADTLAFMQRLAADPAAFDFSEVSEVALCN